MKFWMRGVALAAAAVAVSIMPTGPAAAAPACDRACLGAALDAYLSAVLKHDPKAAPLAIGHKATSNAAVLPDGDGIWRTATGLGAIQRRYYDPQAGNVVYFGLLQEGDHEDVVALRVKVADRKITEAEWTIARKTDGNMFSLEGLAAYPPPPQGPIPQSERAPRDVMVATGNSYFDGIEKHDGAMVPHVPGCERIENGFKVTNRIVPPRPAAPPAGGALPGGGPPLPAAAPGATEETRAGDCVSGFEGFAKTIRAASPRRVVVVDEEAGVVVLPTILQRFPGSTLKRNLLTEIFYTKNGKISAIYAAMYYLDPSAPNTSGW